MKQPQHISSTSSQLKFFIRGATLFLLLAFNINARAVCTNTGTALSATTTVVNINCTSNDGSITVNAVNGFIDAAALNGTGYSYAITAGPITRPTQSSNIFASLPTGTYTVSITDCNNTAITSTATISGTIPATLSYSPTLFRSICANNNGVKIGASGGRTPYTINIISSPAGSVPVISGDTIRGLAAGTLNVQITDACGTTLGAITTIATTYPIPASTALSTNLFYGGCNGVVGDLYHSISVPYINYSLTGLPGGTNLSLAVDSFYTELFFNGTLMETITPATVNQLQGSNVGMTFTGYGFGIYTLRTYAKCAGLIKTDSIVIGNRPSSPTGTNTNLGITSGGLTSRFGCTDFDFRYSVSGSFIGGVSALGRIVDAINPVYKLKVISGASHVGDSVFSTNTYVYTASINNLTYSATPYVFEITDACGVKDTFYHTQNVPAFMPQPTGTFFCDGSSLNPIYQHANIINAGSVPRIYPFKTTVLSGPVLNWTTYPITIVDTAGLLAALVPRLPVPNPSTVRIAYENACGQKDTTIWTINCTPNTPGTVSYTVTPHCGNLGDITLVNATSGTKLGVGNVSGPTSATTGLYPNFMTNTDVSKTYLNIPAGTYIFRGALGQAPTGNTPASSIQPRYIGGASGIIAAQTAIYGYPVTITDAATNYRASITFGSPIDTSKLRIYDTVFTVVVPSSTLGVSASENYLCVDGSSSANVLVHTSGSASPFNFAFSYGTSSSGPWSTSTSDSLLTVSPVTAGSPIWIRVTDVCGSIAIASSTVGSVASATATTCAGDSVIIAPNPYSNSFIYELKRVSTGTITTYPYGTPISIDLSVPANAGTYVLYYKLASAGSTGCVVDSLQFTVLSPCSVVLPLHLLKFDGVLQHGTALLNWSTANEENSSHFEIEYSTNGSNFTRVGMVQSLHNVTGGSYTFSYAQPDASAFYRLKIVDKDGAYSYSKTVQLKGVYNNSIATVVPNPAMNKISVTGFTGKATIRLINVLGQMAMETEAIEHGYNIDISHLSKGIYTVQVIIEGHISAHIKLIKN